MRKYLLIITFLLFAAAVMGQKKSIVLLKSSSRIEHIVRNGIDILKVYNGIFQEEYSTLRSDSAYFYQANNTFDAFGHVNISQGDTLNIYSDKLNYNRNTKIAILTDHVSMVDKDATLTTNYLTYNTATRYGTYTNGGKLVNKDNTLTSKNGYYFANTRDSYFRYDVHLVTTDAIIATDTLRYNSGSRIAYFYGPTNIYGKKGGKDNDTLYTENGNYNTITEQAFFGKKNLYKQGTKTLKGDSLFYDRKVGYGRAVKNVTFNDREQKMTLKGDLGTYYKSDERTVMTENAYGIIITEDRDTSKKDTSVKKSLIIRTDSLTKTKKQATKTADSVLNKAAAKLATVKKPQIGTDSLINRHTISLNDSLAKKVVITMPPVSSNSGVTVSVTTFPYVPKVSPAALKAAAKAKANSSKFPYVDKTAAKIKDKDKTLPDIKPVLKDSARIKYDTIYYAADTLETQIVTYKALKDLLEKRRLANIRDTSVKAKAPSIVYKKAPKYITISPPAWVPDSAFMHRDYFGKPKPEYIAPKKKIVIATAPKKLSKQDSLKRLPRIDSVYMTRKVELSDTSRIRILSAYHNAKIFKSDLQAKSDSAFYSNSDSTIRMFVHPMMWTEGSQLSGDTINLQMKNKKLDNLELFPSAFIVSIEKGDSVHFNQVGGKKMRGFFKNDKLNRMFVDGNAETISFPRDSLKQVTEMHRSLSSRIRINFDNGQLSDVTFLSKPEHRYGPLDKFTDDDKVLKGFIWKPKDRPVSKESIIPSVNKNRQKKAAGKIPPPGKTQAPGKKHITVTAKKDTTVTRPLANPLKGIKAGQDSTTNIPTAVKPGTMSIKKDSTVNKQPPAKTVKDTSVIKKPNALQMKKDTSNH